MRFVSVHTIEGIKFKITSNNILSMKNIFTFLKFDLLINIARTVFASKITTNSLLFSLPTSSGI